MHVSLARGRRAADAEIPSDARVLVVWIVSSGTADYAYVFGEGTVDTSAGTFRVELDAPAPSAALNSNRLGVGFIVLSTNQEVRSGDDITTVAEEELLGAAERYAVNYTNGARAAVADIRGWAADFPAGYAVGRGITIPGSPFEGFEPVDADSVELVIDDWDELEFVNWT